MRRPTCSDTLLGLLLLVTFCAIAALLSPVTLKAGAARDGTSPLDGIALQVSGAGTGAALAPAALPTAGEVSRLRASAALGKPKIVYSFNPDDDLAAIRR